MKEIDLKNPYKDPNLITNLVVDRHGDLNLSPTKLLISNFDDFLGI